MLQTLLRELKAKPLPYSHTQLHVSPVHRNSVRYVSVYFDSTLHNENLSRHENDGIAWPLSQWAATLKGSCARKVHTCSYLLASGSLPCAQLIVKLLGQFLWELNWFWRRLSRRRRPQPWKETRRKPARAIIHTNWSQSEPEVFGSRTVCEVSI